MILGQLGIALAAKKLDAKVSLGWLFAAAALLDLIWPIMVYFRLDSFDIDPTISGVVPIKFVQFAASHSLTTAILCAVAFGGFYYSRRRRFIGAMVVGAVTLSHWGVDLVLHRHDLPLTPFTARVMGFGVWNSMNATVAFEFGLFAIGILIYCWSSRDHYLKVKPQFWMAMILIAGLYLGTIISTPQSNDDVTNWVLLMWGLIPIGFWIDHKKPDSYQALR